MSCLFWFAILTTENASLKRLLFAGALLLGTLEKASRIADTFSMERDWVPTLAFNVPDKARYNLTHLNTVMRRIDISCKLFAPLAVAPFISAVTPAYSTFGIAALSLASWGIERWSVRKVYRQQPRLQEPKRTEARSLLELGAMNEQADHVFAHATSTLSPHASDKWYFPNISKRGKAFVKAFTEGLRYFFSTPLWLPATCIGLLHASVLNYGGTLVTYLLNAGFSLNLVTVARASGSLFDFGSTLAFPLGVSILTGMDKGGSHAGAKEAQYELLAANERAAEDESDEAVERAKQGPASLDLAVVKVALWGLCGHFLTLVGVVLWLGACSLTPPDSSDCCTFFRRRHISTRSKRRLHKWPTTYCHQFHVPSICLCGSSRSLDLRSGNNAALADAHSFLKAWSLCRHGDAGCGLSEPAALDYSGNMALPGKV